MATRQTDHDLFDAFVERSRRLINFGEQRRFLFIANARYRINVRIQRRQLVSLPGLQSLRLTSPGDRLGSGRGLSQCWQHELVRIGESGFFSANCAHTNALVEVKTTLTNDAVLERPAFLTTNFKIQIGIVHAALHHRIQCRVQMFFIQTCRFQRAQDHGIDSILFAVAQAHSNY